MNRLDEKIICRFVDEAHLFRSLSAETRGYLKEVATVRRFASSEVLIAEDEEGLELMIIVSGKVRVSVLGPEEDVELAVLGSGALIGEVSVLTEARRTSTVTALEEVAVIAFMADTIRDVALDNPGMKDLLERLVEARARHAISKMPNV